MEHALNSAQRRQRQGTLELKAIPLCIPSSRSAGILKNRRKQAQNWPRQNNGNSEPTLCSDHLCAQDRLRGRKRREGQAKEQPWRNVPVFPYLLLQSQSQSLSLSLSLSLHGSCKEQRSCTRQTGRGREVWTFSYSALQWQYSLKYFLSENSALETGSYIAAQTELKLMAVLP